MFIMGLSVFDKFFLLNFDFYSLLLSWSILYIKIFICNQN